MQKALLVIFISASILTAKAQTLGIKVSPNVFTQFLLERPTFGFTEGVFYEQYVLPWLAMETGLHHTYYEDHTEYAWIFYQPADGFLPPKEDIPVDYHIMEFPFDVKLDLSAHKPDSKWQYYFTGGYGFGMHLGKRYAGHDRKLHFFRAGFELGRDIKEKWRIATGLQYKYAWNGGLGYYNPLNRYSLFVKTGLNFKKKTE